MFEPGTNCITMCHQKHNMPLEAMQYCIRAHLQGDARRVVNMIVADSSSSDPTISNPTFDLKKTSTLNKGDVKVEGRRGENRGSWR